MKDGGKGILKTMFPFDEDTLSGSSIPRARFGRSSGKGPLFEHLLSTSEKTTTHEKRIDVYDVNESMDKSFGNADGKYAAKAESAGITLDLLSNTSNNFSAYSDTTDSGLNLSSLFGCDIFNDSSCWNASDSNSTLTNGEEFPEHAYWTLCLLVFPVFTVFGNILVVLSVYRERSLRHVTNYFICSLAVADILVAVIVMPPAVFMEVSGFSLIIFLEVIRF